MNVNKFLATCPTVEEVQAVRILRLLLTPGRGRLEPPGLVRQDRSRHNERIEKTFGRRARPPVKGSGLCYSNFRGQDNEPAPKEATMTQPTTFWKILVNGAPEPGDWTLEEIQALEAQGYKVHQVRATDWT